MTTTKKTGVRLSSFCFLPIGLRDPVLFGASKRPIPSGFDFPCCCCTAFCTASAACDITSDMSDCCDGICDNCKISAAATLLRCNCAAYAAFAASTNDPCSFARASTSAKRAFLFSSNRFLAVASSSSCPKARAISCLFRSSLVFALARSALSRCACWTLACACASINSTGFCFGLNQETKKQIRSHGKNRQHKNLTR